ncbi:outer membrane beta-barrel protein [Empedobacter brevis]|uniref:outer membrane beta-barrel protein n=1 Tax=Empedobacter brevis TaxID=247 RepID=UPI00289C086E|nr:outer membrane beta-barrel protein [Empedobacter brevis]
MSIKLFILILTGTLLFNLSLAQRKFNGIINNKIDSMATVGRSAIYLINKSDSILLSYTFSDPRGNFSLYVPTTDSAVLIVSAKGYIDYNEEFKYSDKIKKISLTKNSIILDEIQIHKKIPILIKGDTIEYNASSYKTEKNANVEELLKQLPGLRIDRNGGITANGKTVNKVLLDGEEFFNSDPTLLTRNIRSDMVDKIQVYDTKSDFEKLTSIKDQNQNEKTINVRLKEDKKKGQFGELVAILGNLKKYDLQAKLNRFSNTSKFSVYGLIGNVGTTALSASEENKYGFNIKRPGIIVLNTNTSVNSFNGKYNGEGLPQSFSTGGHYSTTTNNSKTTLNTNIVLNGIDLEKTSNSLDQLITDKSDYERNNNVFNKSKLRKNNIDVIIKHNIDSLSDLKFDVNYLQQKTTVEERSISNLKTGNENFKYLNTINSDGQEKSLNLAGRLTRKFGLKQSLSLSGTYNTAQNNGTAYVLSNNDKNTTNLNQKKDNERNLSVIALDVVYSYKFSKKFSSIFSYSFLNNSNNANLSSYNFDGLQYSQLDSSTSSLYKIKQSVHLFSPNFKYNLKKVAISLSNTFLFSDTKLIDKLTNQGLIDNIFNANPQVKIDFDVSTKSSISFKYVGTTVQPSITERIPYLDNSDPQNLKVGNPALKSTFKNTISGTLNYFNPINSVFLGISIGHNQTLKPIIYDLNIDDKGIKTYSAQNGEKASLNEEVAIFFGKELTKKIRIASNLNTSLNEFYNKIDGDFAKNSILKISPEFNISYTDLNIAKLSYSINPYYENFKNNLSSIDVGGLYSIKMYFELDLYKIKKITNIKIDGWHERKFGNNNVFPSYNQNLINVKLYKDILKNKSLQLSCGIYNILNSNTRYSRTLYQSMQNQIYANTIPRFYNISLKYSFSKF